MSDGLIPSRKGLVGLKKFKNVSVPTKLKKSERPSLVSCEEQLALQNSKGGYRISAKRQLGLFVTSVQMRLLVAEEARAADGVCGTSNHFHPPFKGVLVFSSEVVDMRLEMEFKDVILVNVL